MSSTFLRSVLCGRVKYEFRAFFSENGYGIALSVGGRRQTFASDIEDPMMAMAAFGIRRRPASHFDDLGFGRELFGSVLNFASNSEDTMSVVEGYGLKEEPDDTACARGVELIQSRFGLRVLPPPIQESPRVEASTVYSGRCVAYSFIAMFCFGVTNYLIAVATGVLDSSVEKYYAVGAEWKMLAIIWGVGGLPGMLCCAGHWLHAGRVELFWSAELADTPTITWKTKALTLIGGLGLGVSMSLMKKAFVFTSPADKGPVSAVLCSTIIVVSVYGHFMFRELLSKRHALLIGIVSGVVSYHWYV
ncbi:hypothetical protein FOZ62_000527 [Perkinsus olseni]|uniref:Uncharacterized protein n=1 Tax=Perkinsus olseni TaxID=32597 RepID=A0A7J6Q683_PEROL|nr:hypothetical protein FOZ62_000527 [Perkinsus olseni]